MAVRISIYECGPRDGWQNLRQMLSFEEKTRIIDGLAEAGISEMEVTSFVSPKAIPQMRDAGRLAAYCVEKHPDIRLWALTPNLRGVQDAWQAGIRRVSYVISLSESHNKANINRTHEQSFAELGQILAEYPELEVCVGMATVFGCPFEGIPATSAAVSFAEKLWAMGVRSINLADTIGIADPAQVREVVSAMKSALPECEFQIHIHDTRNMGMVNTLAAIECGIKTVQSTLGGLGGCPFAPGASGNTATEDLAYMLQRMGYETGVDFNKLLALSKHQKSFVEGIYSGHQVNITTQPCC